MSWKDYVIARDVFDQPGLRMTYCEGSLEIMSPSLGHEVDKKAIARLVETYAFLRRLRLNAYGSTTFRSEASERGAEPDECYCIDRVLKRENEFPDIVLEVIHSSPLLDKLHVYLGLRIPEIWLFRDGRFEIHGLSADRYERLERSRLLPDLDFSLLARLAAYDDQQQALDELRNTLS